MAQENIFKTYDHYGLDLLKMKENGEVHDFLICETEKAKDVTGNMAGFGMENSQQIIIDYDKDYSRVLIRRIRKKNGTQQRVPHRED